MNSRTPNGRHVLAREIFQLVCKTVCVRECYFSTANVGFSALLFLIFIRVPGVMFLVFLQERKTD